MLNCFFKGLYQGGNVWSKKVQWLEAINKYLIPRTNLSFFGHVFLHKVLKPLTAQDNVFYWSTQVHANCYSAFF